MNRIMENIKKTVRIIMLGPPGAGKGTQALALSEYFEIPTISTGAMIRAEINAGSEIGREAEGLIKAGQLVPDSVIIGMLCKRLEQGDCKNGYILDGVPRTIAQAEAIDSFAKINAVVDIDMADHLIIGRLGGRRECSACGKTFHIKLNPPAGGTNNCDSCNQKLVIRPDDMPETIQRRLETYHKQTEPLKRFYADRGILIQVNGDREIDRITKEIISSIEVVL